MKNQIPHNALLAVVLAGLTALYCSTSKLAKSGQGKTVGKTFVIIGASSGFGKCVALHPGSYYADVVLAPQWTVPLAYHAANYSSGTPRMAAIDNPKKAVKVISWSSQCPCKEVQVGWKAKFSYYFPHRMPHFCERFTVNVAHKYQINNAPAAPSTDGTLFKPMPNGTDVDDSVRERMKKQDEERNARQKI
jgi:hypothetical protein